MEQLTNEEKAKIFAMYLGCKVNDGTSVTETLMGVGYLFNEYHALYAPKCSATYPIERCKLLLKSLEDITDEDSYKAAEICGIDALAYGHPMETVTTSARHNIKDLVEESSALHQFLISRGYAVPIYPYNKTAIQLGIAINVSSTPYQRG